MVDKARRIEVWIDTVDLDPLMFEHLRKTLEDTCWDVVSKMYNETFGVLVNRHVFVQANEVTSPWGKNNG